MTLHHERRPSLRGSQETRPSVRPSAAAGTYSRERDCGGLPVFQTQDSAAGRKCAYVIFGYKLTLADEKYHSPVNYTALIPGAGVASCYSCCCYYYHYLYMYVYIIILTQDARVP